MFYGACQIESLDNRMVIGSLQPNDLGITCRRFRKQVRIRGYEVRELHPWLVRIPPRPQHVTLEVNRRGVVWCDRENVYLVAILYFKGAHLRANRFRIAGVTNLDTQHRAFFMSY